MRVNIEDIELISVEEALEVADREYATTEANDYEEEVSAIELDGLQLWDRTPRRRERMTLDRETLMDLYGESEYETY
jgi:hypothetical protein